MRTREFGNDATAQLCALLLTAAMLMLLGRVLLRLPEAGTPMETHERMQLRFFSREPVLELPVLPAQLPPRQMPEALASARGSAGPDVATLPAPVQPAASAALKPSLFDPEGRVKVPGDAADALPDGDAASRVFEHRDPLQRGVGERATANLFSDTAAGTRQSRTQRFLYGRDIQAAQARRPPEVAFNPNLHERPSDLGSEATGDAYKAAPIRFEKAPGLDGEASRRLRASIGELEKRMGSCSVASRQRWMAPVLRHLDELQRVEYSYNNGADPVAAEHTLPSAADSAYDLARRALWHAGRQMESCAG